MKKIAFILFLLGLINSVACNVLTNAGAEHSASNNSNAEMLKSNVSVANTPHPHQIKSKQPLIWTGYIRFDEVAIESPGSFTGGDAVDEEFSGEIALETTVEVDVMNCAGFLATAELTYTRKPSERSDPGWNLRIVPERVASDMQEKIKICHYYSESPNYSEVFAIAPLDNKRKNIKIGKVDTRKLFASLDKETKEMANTTEKYVGREKNNLTLANDNWTDIDGDGQIDLVEVSGNCGNKDYTCSLVFLLINDKWKKIGEIGPA